MLSPLASATLAGVEHERSGLGSSVSNATRQVGVVVGIAVLGTLVQARATHEALRTLTAARVPNAGHLATTIAHNGARGPQAPDEHPATCSTRSGPDPMSVVFIWRSVPPP